MAQGNPILNDWKRQFGPAGKRVNQLFILNVIIFIVFGIAGAIFKYSGIVFHEQFVQPYLALSSDVGKVIRKPWTLFTHAFLHANLWHILFNMLWLYFIGKTLEEYLGKRRVLPVYLFGILVGAIVYLLVTPFITDNTQYAVGASAAVSAVVIATATLLPNHALHLFLIGRVRYVYVAIFFVISDLMILGAANFAHLGGALAGFLFIRFYQKGHDMSIGFNKIGDGVIAFFYRSKNRPVLKKKPGGKQKSAGKRDYFSKKFQNESKMCEEKLNIILDKIAASGYESLSKEEKAFLFQTSNQN